MVRHVVLLRWKAGTSATSIEAAQSALRGMQGTVPGVVAVHCGPTFGRSAEEYPTMLVVDLEDHDAREVYATHPAHLDPAHEHVVPILERSITLDLDLSTTAATTAPLALPR